jgi:hypothetical protein
VTAILLLRRFWPVLAAVAVLLALWSWGNARFDAGVAKERAEWTAEASRLRAIAAQEAAQRAIAINAAHDADTQRNAALDRLLAPINDKVKSYANTPNGRAVCLSADGRLLAQQAVAAANASIAASSGARR